MKEKSLYDNNLEVLKDIPIKFDLEKMFKHFKVNDKTQQKQRELIEELTNLATILINPRATYKPSYVENKKGITLDIGKVSFESNILRKNLDKIERVFPYIITIGKELENEAISIKDLLKQYYLEEMADLALHYTLRHLTKHLKEKYRLEQLSRMSPGSLADWPITQQKELFSIFDDTQKIIGVNLNDSFLMIPRKSISGIYYPTKIEFYSCQLCSRQKCIRRQAPYDSKLAESYKE